MTKKLYNARLYDPRTGKMIYVNSDNKNNAVDEINGYLFLGCKISWCDFSF